MPGLRANPRDNDGEPYCTPVGRDKIFHQTDIARIERALREGMQCRSSSGRRAQAKRESEWKLAQELTGDPLLSNSSVKSKNASKNTDNTRRPNLSLVQGSRPS
jgi:hypothetical protein